MIIDGELYDALAWVGRILLPALASLYAGLAQLWPLPYPEAIPGTIALLDVFLNALLARDSKVFFDEHEIVDAVVDRNEEKG